MQDELADMMEQADEVQEALGRNYNMAEIDDDELAAELDALGDEIALDDDATYLDDVLNAPEAPSNKPEKPEAAKNKVSTVFSCYSLQDNFNFILSKLLSGWYCS